MQKTLQDWKEIHPDFTEDLRQEWIKWFRWTSDVYQAAQGWLAVGLDPTEAKFAKWLVNEKYVLNYIPKEEGRNSREEGQKLFRPTSKKALKQVYLNDDWVQIHPDFANKSSTWEWTNTKQKLTYRQLWEKNAFTYQDAQEWINIGLHPWKYEVIANLKKEGYTPQSWQNQANDWLEENYPREGICLRKEEVRDWRGNVVNNFGKKRSEITRLDISQKNLKGTLDLSDFVNLEKLNCSGNEQLTGSLASLENLTNLKELDIRNTDIDSGLEYLPASLEKLECSGFLQKELRKHRKSNEEDGEWIEKLSTDIFKVRSTRPLRTAGVNRKRKEKYLKKRPKENVVFLNRLISQTQQQSLKEKLKFLEAEKARLEKLNQQLAERVPFLEKQIEELNYSIQTKEQALKQAVIFFTDEEEQALKELIQVHKDYQEAKKKRKGADILYEQCYHIRKELKAKLGQKFIESLEIILTNFEELYQREWDLEAKLEEKEQALSIKQTIEKDLKELDESIKQVNINLIQVQQGHALINCELGDNTNLSHIIYQLEPTSEFQSHTLQSPKPN